MELIIREALPCDYLAIHSLITNELGYEQIDFEKLCVRLNIMRMESNYSTIVAEFENDIVGFIGMSRGLAYNVDGEYIQISALAVRNDMQNIGIGSQLLKWIEDYAIRNDIKSLILTSRFHRTNAHSFYEHMGYTKKSYAFIKDLS